MSPLIRRWNASFGNCAWPWFPPWFQRLFRRCLGDFEGGRFTKTAQGWGWLVHVFVACFCCSKDEQKRLGFIFPLFHLILTWTRFLEHFLGDSGISSWTCIWHYWEGVQPKPWFFDGEITMFLAERSNENRRWRTRIAASPESRKDANLGYRILRFDPQNTYRHPKGVTFYI